MFEIIFNRLSTHAQFSAFLALAAGIIMFIIAWIFNMPFGAIPAFTFLFGAAVYLVLDFYEHFGAGE